ncbi:MAG: PucC family protein, partial [Betaproteobacteria bacterium]
MTVLTRRVIAQWAALGPRFLPFADAASADLPLSRLLRLALFQVSVGMAMVLLVGTIVSAFAFGAFLREFSPARLVQVIQACAAITLVLNTVAL